MKEGKRAQSARARDENRRQLRLPGRRRARQLIGVAVHVRRDHAQSGADIVRPLLSRLGNRDDPGNRQPETHGSPDVKGGDNKRDAEDHEVLQAHAAFAFRPDGHADNEIKDEHQGADAHGQGEIQRGRWTLEGQVQLDLIGVSSRLSSIPM